MSKFQVGQRIVNRSNQRVYDVIVVGSLKYKLRNLSTEIEFFETVEMVEDWYSEWICPSPLLAPQAPVDFKFKVGDALVKNRNGHIYDIREISVDKIQLISRATNGAVTFTKEEIKTEFRLCPDFIPDAGPAVEDALVMHDRDGLAQPWQILSERLTPEELRGYMKGLAIAQGWRSADGRA